MEAYAAKNPAKELTVRRGEVVEVIITTSLLMALLFWQMQKILFCWLWKTRVSIIY